MANIYGIVNRLTDTIEYVGQTKGTVAGRWNSHKSKAKHLRGVPFDIEMAVNGIDNYYPIRLVECYENQLDLLERVYIQLLQPKGNKK
jgi:hypothetical protein